MALIFSHHHGETFGFKIFICTMKLQNILKTFTFSWMWWIYFNCSVSESICKTLKNCSSKGLLEWLPWHHFDMAMSDGSHHMYNVLYAVAHTLHEMILQQEAMQPLKN
jgi:hypothetical protein